MIIWWPISLLIPPRTSQICFGFFFCDKKGKKGISCDAGETTGRQSTFIDSSAGKGVRLKPNPWRHITLSKARSRLYQRRFWQPNNHFAAFFKIYKICISFAPLGTQILQKIVQIRKKKLNSERCKSANVRKSCRS